MHFTDHPECDVLEPNTAIFFAAFLKVQACDFLIVFVLNLSIRKLILDFILEDLEASVDLEHVQ